MTRRLRFFEVFLASIIVVVVAVVDYSFFHSLGTVLFAIGLMCLVPLFRVGGINGGKIRLRVKFVVFILGIALIIVGILLVTVGF